MSRESPLVSTEELRGLLDRVCLLDVRYRLGGAAGHPQYLEGHLPGATYVDLETDLADPPGERGRHPLPDPRRFEAAMRRCGVGNDRPVVVYDDVSGTSAARCWWLLRYHGHPDVRVLDGGYARWVGDGGPVEHGNHAPAAGDFAADPGHLPVLDAEGASRLTRSGVLVDARAAERYRGEVEPIDPVAGHIPGAVNVPTSENLVDQDGAGHGRMRPADELDRVYRSVGVTAATEVGVYCGSGVTAAHDVLALAVLGRTAALYPGSWSAWVSDPSRPVARSDSPGS